MDPAAATAAARPQSVIGSACSALIATAHQVSTDVTNFVRGCRSARVDLAPVMRELSELQMVLQLLDDYDAQDGAVPDELQSHLVPIITNCATVVKRVDEVLERHGGGQGAHRWPLEGKSDMADLSKSMGVHRAVLGLVSDLVAILVSRHSRGYDESADGRADEQLQISEVLEEFRALGSSIIMSYSNATLAREQFALQIHLGQIVTYTETLVSAEIWDDAVKTLDAAQRSSSPNRSQKIRGSIPVPAPLRSRSFADKDTGSFCIPNKGLENLLPMGPPENYDVNRPGSKLFTPNRAPEPDSFPAGGDAPATGFIVMDGFINSDQDNALSSPTCLSQIRDGNYLGIPGTESRPVSRTTFGHRHSGGEQPVTTAGVPPRNSTSKGSRVTRPARPLTAGLEVVISHEKEVAPSGSKEEEITEEALAFAQVPVHILGRLSVNLVGQLYPNSRSGGSDRTSFNQSLSTVKTDGEEQEAECDDAASASTSNTGSLRDGNLQFSQIDISKVPSHSIPYQTLESQTPSGSQPVPSADSLFRSSSYAASQRTDDSTLPISSRPSQDTTSLPNSHLKPNCQLTGGPHGLSQMQSMSTMNTETFRMQKPLPRAPIVYIPGYPGPFIKKKVVVVGNFSCGKTCLITYASSAPAVPFLHVLWLTETANGSRLAKGHFPRVCDVPLLNPTCTANWSKVTW